MMGFAEILKGFAIAFDPVNLMACFVGCLIGTVVGVLPGLGPTAAMALMLPFSIQYGATAGLILLAGVWYGAMYGGSTTSILVNIPGEAASVVTCLDGYQMARRGRAGAALALVAIGSWVAGTLALIGLQIFAPPLGVAALRFGPPEYLSLMIFSFVLLSALIGENQAKGILMLALGLFLGIVGIDPILGVPRFTLGPTLLMQGIDLIAVAVGLFGVAEIIQVIIAPDAPKAVSKVRLRDLYPNTEEVRRSVKPTLRGSVLGFFMGLIPGLSPAVATFFSYSLEKRLSRYPEQFGSGMVEGVVAPESANNGAVIGALLPLLALGIPFSATAAVLLSGLRMHKVEAGPMLFQDAPDIFWGFVAAMYLGNLMLLILNLPLVGIFSRIATIRPQVLMPVVSILCLVGTYSIRFSTFDIWVMIMAGVFGFFCRRWGFPVAPLVIGMVLGPMTENNLRLTMQLFSGQLLPIFYRPVAMGFLVSAVLFQLFVYGRSRKTSSTKPVDRL
ncbi:MAG: tripartite tricarboxylate transporter permease [Deltaproteobacteria bacterium]|nr:tripartite tricarboxylate transporter permease [Deltaproteobacteria bacterium]